MGNWKLGMRAVVAAMAAALALAGCADPADVKSNMKGGAGGEGGLVPVVLPVAANAGYAPWDVADKKGLFKKHGLDATLQTFDNGVVGTQAMLAGQVQAGGTVEMPLVSNLAQGADIIVPALWFTGQELRVVVKSNIKTPEDLRGKKIGVQEGGINDYALQRYLEEHNIDSADVKLVNIAGAEQVAALAKGSIDGFVNEDPIVSSALEEMGDKASLLQPSIGDLVTVRNYLQFPRDWAEQNPETVQAILKALIDANAFIEKNPEEASEIASERIGVPAETLRKFWSEGGIRWDVYLDEDARTALQDVAEWMTSKGLVKSKPEVDKVFEPKYLREIAPDAVTLKDS